MQDSTFSTKQKESGKTSSLQLLKNKENVLQGVSAPKIKQQNGQTKTLEASISLGFSGWGSSSSSSGWFMVCAKGAGFRRAFTCETRRRRSSNSIKRPWTYGRVHILDSEIFRKVQKRKTSWWLNQTIWKILIIVKLDLDHFPNFRGENNPNAWNRHRIEEK